MPWHRIKIGSNSLQHLPDLLRRFPPDYNLFKKTAFWLLLLKFPKQSHKRMAKLETRLSDVIACGTEIADTSDRRRQDHQGHPLPEKPIYISFSGDKVSNAAAKAFLEPRGVPTFPRIEDPSTLLCLLPRNEFSGSIENRSESDNGYYLSAV